MVYVFILSVQKTQQTRVSQIPCHTQTLCHVTGHCWLLSVVSRTGHLMSIFIFKIVLFMWNPGGTSVPPAKARHARMDMETRMASSATKMQWQNHTSVYGVHWRYGLQRIFFGLKLSSWPPGHWVPHVLVMPLPPDLATLIDPSGVEVLEAGPSGTWTSIPGTYIDYQTNVVVSIWLFGPSYHCFQPLLHWSTIGNLAPWYSS